MSTVINEHGTIRVLVDDYTGQPQAFTLSQDQAHNLNTALTAALNDTKPTITTPAKARLMRYPVKANQ